MTATANSTGFPGTVGLGITLAGLRLMALMALRFTPGAPAILAYGALAVFALTSRSNAILALALSWIFTMANPGLLQSAAGGSAERYVVLLGALGSVVIHGLRDRVVRWDPFLTATVLLTGFLVAHSVLLSPIPAVSILKAVSWGVAMLTSLFAWVSLSPRQRTALASRLFWLLAIVMIASLPLLIMPIGYLRNGSGFQGLMNHPQAFGLTMAIFTVWSAARLLERPSPRWVDVALTGLGLLMVILSQARTGGLAMTAGLGLAIIIVMIIRGKRLRFVAPGLATYWFWGLLFLGFLASLAAANTLWRWIQDFLWKRGGSSSLLDIYDASRGALIDLMMANIANDPWRGIGFGIASTPSLMVIERNSFFGLPVGAAIEKGTAPLAVLEETGVAGFILVMGWVAWLVLRASRSRLAPMAVLLTLLALNLGENTFFSAGGQGLLGIVLLGWVYFARENPRAG
jgi:hypothetical protein